MKILVLDDDEDLVAGLCQLLAERSFDVDGATSAHEAIELMRQKRYDLVLLDYAMPRHDGIWFMTNATIPRSTKVLLMTGLIHRNMINTMFDLGACGYMIKPFDEDELMRHLNFFVPGCLSH